MKPCDALDPTQEQICCQCSERGEYQLALSMGDVEGREGTREKTKDEIENRRKKIEKNNCFSFLILLLGEHMAIEQSVLSFSYSFLSLKPKP